MKVGIPKALLYHRHGALWERFFAGIGVDVVLSEDRGKEGFDEGCRHCLDDICLPIKNFFGHVLDLRDKADRIFIPRVVSIEKRERGRSFTCPKLIGLPDMVAAAIKDIPPVIDPTFNTHKKNDIWPYIETAKKLGVGPVTAARSFFSANGSKDKRPSLPANDANSMMVGLISHSYNLCGSYPSPNIDKMLRELGVVPVTAEVYDEKGLRAAAEGQFRELSWNYEREMLGGAIHMLREPGIRGCVIVSNFGCGPDSLTADYITRHAKRTSSVPMMTITLDEHTSGTGLGTRLEAFVDMIRMEK